MSEQLDLLAAPAPSRSLVVVIGVLVAALVARAERATPASRAEVATPRPLVAPNEPLDEPLDKPLDEPLDVRDVRAAIDMAIARAVVAEHVRREAARGNLGCVHARPSAHHRKVVIDPRCLTSALCE